MDRGQSSCVFLNFTSHFVSISHSAILQKVVLNINFFVISFFLSFFVSAEGLESRLRQLSDFHSEHLSFSFEDSVAVIMDMFA